jgi:uncharacterized protein (TIGR00369 family)
MTDKSRFEPHHKYVTQYIDAHPYLSWIGIHLLEIEYGRLRLIAPFSKKLVNPERAGGNGVIHGGILATLLDHASGMSLRTTLDDPTNATQVTTDLHISYLRPATNDLYAEAEVVRAGETMGVVQSAIESTTPDGEQKTVAVGQASFRRYLNDETE